MAESLKRVDLQNLAAAKIADAALLMAHGRHGNAFYLAGYAIELALKACIAKQMTAQAIPDKAFINAIYVHDLKKLMSLAGLNAAFQTEQRNSPTFSAYWGIIGEWSESSRYVFTDNYTAVLMLQAVSDPNEGLMRWIRQHW